MDDPRRPTDPTPTPPSALTVELLDGLSSRTTAPASYKAAVQRFYNTVTAQLDSTESGSYARFLNYGYVPDGIDDRAVAQLPRNLLGRNSVRLILEVVGAASLVGSRVLDVGCGRGGTVATLRAYCGPRAVVGVDLSPAAIAYCRRSNPDPGSAFLVGDAERLPFRDGAFDALINVESSHSYPDLDAFYSQVRRVLRPDGMFMYTDTVPADELADRRATAAALGFAVTVERDVTANVLRSCDEQAAIHAGAFEAANDRTVLADFLALPDSSNYRSMASGRLRYMIWQWRRAQ